MFLALRHVVSISYVYVVYNIYGCIYLFIYLLVLHKYHEVTSGVGGVMVSIAAFQAVDLGSIPGQRTLFLRFLFFSSISLGYYNRKSKYNKTD